MLVKIKRLRQNGRRMHNREIENTPHLDGDLSLAGMIAGYVLELRDPNKQAEDGVVARLHDAKVITIQGDRMLFKGEERPQGDSGPAIVQEWSVQLLC